MSPECESTDPATPSTPIGAPGPTTSAGPAMLAPLLDQSTGRLTAAQAVERLRLWDPSSSAAAVKGRPRVFLNMACTADGRATLGGRSGPIGNRADQELFHALRTTVDAVLVGAGTARAEHYRRLVRDEAQRRLRQARGLAEEPLACIVSASLALSPESVPLLADPAARVVIVTSSPAGELSAGELSAGELSAGELSAGELSAGELSAGDAPVAYVRTAHEGQLDLPAALAELRARWGVRTVLCEGGPHLNGALLAAGVVDELFLTLAPKLGGGADPQASLRIVCGPELDPPLELVLHEALESEGCLLLRYGVGGGGER
jgi:riboflavin biosynthesis pyrimidine reductase